MEYKPGANELPKLGKERAETDVQRLRERSHISVDLVYVRE